MAKSKRASGKDGGSSEQQATGPPVIALRMDSTTPEAPRELETAAEGQGGFQVPCTLTGLGAGLSGGMLGWTFGFGGYWMRNLRGGKLKLALADGWGSAQTFGIMGGLYAAVSCFMLRLRQKNDAWNGAASGCATGLALGYKQGPLSALQSCAMLGVFSFFVDSMGGAPAEAAMVAQGSRGRSSSGGGGGGGSRSQRGGGWGQQAGQQAQQAQQAQRSPIELLLSPAVPLLAALAGPCAFGGGCGAQKEGEGPPGRPGGGAVLGCRVRREKMKAQQKDGMRPERRWAFLEAGQINVSCYGRTCRQLTGRGRPGAAASALALAAAADGRAVQPAGVWTIREEIYKLQRDLARFESTTIAALKCHGEQLKQQGTQLVLFLFVFGKGGGNPCPGESLSRCRASTPTFRRPGINPRWGRIHTWRSAPSL